MDAEIHFDALSDTERGRAETICDGVALSRGKELRADTAMYQYVHTCCSPRHPTKASLIDFLAIIFVMLAGYVWLAMSGWLCLDGVRLKKTTKVERRQASSVVAHCQVKYGETRALSIVLVGTRKWHCLEVAYPTT
jgi:hypothetical protein